MLSAFGRLIRKIRIDLNLKLKDMARDMHISHSTLSNIEHGRTSPPACFIDSLCNIYHLDNALAAALRKSAFCALNKITIDLDTLNPEAKELALTFSAHMPSWSRKQCKSLHQSLNDSLSIGFS